MLKRQREAGAEVPGRGPGDLGEEDHVLSLDLHCGHL